MKFFNALRHPRSAFRFYRESIQAGKRSMLLGRIPFASGLGDSAWLLYGIARSLKPKTSVEIGSARGKSACYVGMALAENGSGKLFAIDPHELTEWNDSDSVMTYDLMRGNIKSLGLQDYVEMVRKTSEEAARSWQDRIDLLFIDGDHSYEGVRRDWELFSPHLSDFGVTVFHDTAWSIDQSISPGYRREDMGVPMFVEELRRAGYPVLTLPRDCGVSIVQPRCGGIPVFNGDS